MSKKFQQFNELEGGSLWAHINDALANIYDLNQICKITGGLVAKSIQLSVGISVYSAFYDRIEVWVCHPDGDYEFMFWDSNDPIRTCFNPDTVKFVNRPTGLGSAGSALWKLEQQSVLLSSLHSAESIGSIAPAGVFIILNPPPEAIHHLKGIRQFTNYLALFIERAHLRREVTNKSMLFEIVNVISNALTSTLSLKDIYQTISNPIRQQLNVDSVSIGLLDDETKELVFVRSLMGPLFENLPPLRLKQTEGIAGWVVTHGKHISINNVYNDKRFSPRADKSSGYRTHSILCIPLRRKNKVVGVLQAINKNKGRFDENDINLLNALSNPIAIALQNADLHAKTLAEKWRIETIFSSMSEGMLSVDNQGFIVEANDAWLAMLRTTEDQVLGRDIHTLIRSRPNKFLPFLNDLFEDRLQATHLACEIFVETENWLPVLISGAKVQSANTNATQSILVFNDLSPIRELERMRDDFFHNIVHELRTPLATILLYARMLKQGDATDNPKKEARFLTTIELESDRLQEMVRQMLALAKMESEEIQDNFVPIDIGALFEELLPPLAKRAALKNIVFVEDIEQNLPTIMGHKPTIYSILKNIIDNAIKFTPKGGVHLEAWYEDGWIYFEVKDEGIGIPTQGLNNLFKRFYRATTAVTNSIAGIGLGLYMVKIGIEKHHGTIDVSSTEGEGTTFYVRLPVFRKTEEAAKVNGKNQSNRQEAAT